ncbi:hypothetical protein HYX70_03700 [Candidatus Saccharibacteria bacterium]|nr:hypothetical protein [Candidatus Saccharibacteria bacterium]
MPSKKPKRKVVQGAKVKIIPHLRKEPDLYHLAQAAMLMMEDEELMKRLAKEQKAKNKDKAA